jgi:hypothetical protein
MSERTKVTITTVDGERHVYLGRDADLVYKAVLGVMKGDAPSVIVHARDTTARFEACDLRSVE